jgi:hypothetical protein
MKLANEKTLLETQATLWDIPKDVLESGEFSPEFFGPCFNCGRTVSNYEFCYGCHSFICKDCMKDDQTSGEHKREEHLTD